MRNSKIFVSAIACLIVLLMTFLGTANNNPDNQREPVTQQTTSDVELMTDANIEPDKKQEDVTSEPVKESQSTTEQITESETTMAFVMKEPFYFRTKDQWESHYEKHGIEMGFSNKQEYLDAANKVIYNPESLHKIEKEDGDDIYYLEETNEFVVVSTDGFLRTYFNPSAGIDYFNRQ